MQNHQLLPVSPGLRTIDGEREDTLRLLAIRRRIVSVAKHKMARFGYDAVTLNDIAHSADVPWPEFRVHFEDKPTLIAAILDQGWNSLIPRVLELALRSPNARSGLLSILALMTKMVQEDEGFMRLVLMEGYYPDPETSELRFSTGYRRFMQICRDLIVRGQKEFSVRADFHPDVIASMVVGALQGMLRDRLKAEQEDSVTPYTGTYLMSAYDALISGLKNN